MIRIKDYIFNENEITRIHQDSWGCIEVRTKDVAIDCGKATFEDIEWNYGTDCYEDFVKDLNRQLDRLEEKNKKLKEKINLAENILYDYLYKDGKITEELYLKYKGE